MGYWWDDEGGGGAVKDVIRRWMRYFCVVGKIGEDIPMIFCDFWDLLCWIF